MEILAKSGAKTMETEHWLSVASIIIALWALWKSTTTANQQTGLQKRLTDIEEARERDRWAKEYLERFTVPCITFYDILSEIYAEAFSESPQKKRSVHQAIALAMWPDVNPEKANLWRESEGDGLQVESDHLYSFAEKIYPKCEDRALKKHSVLGQHWDTFHPVRQSIAYYLADAGVKREQSKEFADFLDKSRQTHFPTVKMVAYLELALYAALGTTDAKQGLFGLGKAWSVASSGR